MLVGDDLLEERQPERPPDDRGDVQDLARRRVEAVEAGLERALDERRDRQLVGAHGERPAPVLAPERAALDQVPERLLEEEGVAARALGQELGDRLGQLALGDVPGEHAARVARERAKLDLAVAVRVALACALAEAPGGVLALRPVEEEEASRPSRSRAAGSRGARASPGRPSGGPRRRDTAGAPRRGGRRDRLRPRTSGAGLPPCSAREVVPRRRARASGRRGSRRTGRTQPPARPWPRQAAPSAPAGRAPRGSRRPGARLSPRPCRNYRCRKTRRGAAEAAPRAGSGLGATPAGPAATRSARSRRASLS